MLWYKEYQGTCRINIRKECADSMINKLLDNIVSAIGAFKGGTIYKKYDRINSVFKTPVKLIIGLCVILFTVAGYILSGFSYNHDALIVSLIVFGVFNLVNAMFSAIYKIQIPYISFIVFNALGFLLYMFIISKYEAIGILFMVLFMVLVFIAVWICDMCLLYGAGPQRRIFGGLIVNLVTVILTTVCVFAISAVSYIMQNI